MNFKPKKIKFINEDNLINGEKQLNMILTNKLVLKGCWNKIEKDEFRKER